MTLQLKDITVFDKETNKEALQWAYKQIMDSESFYKCKDPKIFKIQVRLYAKCWPGYWEQKPVPFFLSPIEETAEEIEARLLREIIEHDQDISYRLMGFGNIFGGISLWDDSKTLETQVVSFFKKEYDNFKRNCLIVGGTGSGKTYGVIGYVASQAEKTQSGINAEFLTAYQLYEKQRSAYEEDRNDRDYLEMVKFLIIDDLGTEPQAGFKGSDFLAYFQNLFILRHQKNKNTFITSNLTLVEFEEAYGERFLSRFRETGVIFETTDKDLRQ